MTNLTTVMVKKWRQWQWCQQQSHSSSSHLAVMGRLRISSPTWSTSTTITFSYFRIWLEVKVTATFISLCGGIVPVDGRISNSLAREPERPWRGVEAVLGVSGSRSLVAQMLGVCPSPGTRRWKDIGTRDVFIREHVWVCLKPASQKINSSGVLLLQRT